MCWPGCGGHSLSSPRLQAPRTDAQLRRPGALERRAGCSPATPDCPAVPPPCPAPKPPAPAAVGGRTYLGADWRPPRAGLGSAAPAAARGRAGTVRRAGGGEGGRRPRGGDRFMGRAAGGKEALVSQARRIPARGAHLSGQEPGRRRRRARPPEKAAAPSAPSPCAPTDGGGGGGGASPISPVQPRAPRLPTPPGCGVGCPAASGRGWPLSPPPGPPPTHLRTQGGARPRCPDGHRPCAWLSSGAGAGPGMPEPDLSFPGSARPHPPPRVSRGRSQ